MPNSNFGVQTIKNFLTIYISIKYFFWNRVYAGKVYLKINPYFSTFFQINGFNNFVYIFIKIDPSNLYRKLVKYWKIDLEFLGFILSLEYPYIFSFITIVKNTFRWVFSLKFWNPETPKPFSILYQVCFRRIYGTYILMQLF